MDAADLYITAAKERFEIAEANVISFSGRTTFESTKIGTLGTNSNIGGAP